MEASGICAIFLSPPLSPEVCVARFVADKVIQVTPGEISNVEIMQLAKKYIRPDLSWQTFGIEDMLGTLKSARANCILDGTKLERKLQEYGYKVKGREEALDELFQTMAEKAL